MPCRIVKGFFAKKIKIFQKHFQNPKAARTIPTAFIIPA